MFFYNVKLTLDEILNYVFIAFTDLLVYKYWGSGALLYFFLATFFSMGPHPAAAHILAEHFEFVPGLETYDYIGVWNILNLNLGYHI